VPYCQQARSSSVTPDDKIADALRRLKKRGVLLSILTEED